MTPSEHAEQIAKTISRFVAATAIRMTHGPIQTVSSEELLAYNELKEQIADALIETATRATQEGS